MVNRKLIRPNLAEIKEKFATKPQPNMHDAPQRDAGNGTHARRRMAPPDQTSAEAFYYLKQMNNQTPMVLVLDGGEKIRGHIEWYDRGCLKVHRQDGPNVLIFKNCIKYLFKQEDETSPKSDA